MNLGKHYGVLTVMKLRRASRIVTCRMDDGTRVKCLVKNPHALMVGEGIEAVRDYRGMWKEI